MAGLIGSILGIIALITYFKIYFSLRLRFLDFEAVFGILLMAIAIISSIYINKNNKKEFILLIIVGILIFIYSVGIPHIQFFENGNYFITDFTYDKFKYFINPWDILSLVGILLSLIGISNILKDTLNF